MVMSTPSIAYKAAIARPIPTSPPVTHAFRSFNSPQAS